MAVSTKSQGKLLISFELQQHAPYRSRLCAPFTSFDLPLQLPFNANGLIISAIDRSGKSALQDN
jgi:hypothetical protein